MSRRIEALTHLGRPTGTMTVRSSASRQVVLGIFLSITPVVALAYIDPGSGSYMVQVILTLTATGFFYLRHPMRFFQLVWRWLSSRLRN